ncbi:LysR family transcriptional regulator [Brevibacillus sp. B_LB10_24]|uniref:LysR family transcriptional regulator n=1 Tax=Brevibacillus sp. B_LB10_24 TaxID=3380645 RepID=UPI0038BA8BB4
MDHQLLVFVTVVEKENFSRAAEELHMTQPAVSQHIRMLERTIGSKLLERSNKYVRLTRAGEIVYHHAKEILGLYTRMQRLVDDLMNKASGNLSIGASYTFGEYVLPHIIAALHEQYPLIKPKITIGNTREIAEMVAAHQLDVGIVEGEFHHEQLAIEPFAEDSMSVVVSANHRLAGKSRVDTADLCAETWIIRETGSGTRDATDKMFACFGLVPESTMEFGSNQIIKESVEAGLGITFLSHWAVRKELSLGSLRLLQMEGFPFVRKFYSVTKATQFQTRAVELFLALLRSEI